MLVSMGTHAQSIDTLFRHVPQEELPMLELNARLDMLDLLIARWQQRERISSVAVLSW